MASGRSGQARRWGVGLLAVGVVAGLVRLALPAEAAAAPPAVYQAESATIVKGVAEANHAGYTGTGFVNYDNAVGSYVEWSVPVEAAGPGTLTFRHANGTTVNRPMTIIVNGAAVATAR